MVADNTIIAKCSNPKTKLLKKTKIGCTTLKVNIKLIFEFIIEMFTISYIILFYNILLEALKIL